MRQNNDTPRTERLQEDVNDLIADYGQPIAVFRAGGQAAIGVGVIDAEAHARLHATDLATFRYLYRAYLQAPIDVRVGDTLAANSAAFLVLDVDADVTQHPA